MLDNECIGKYLYSSSYVHEMHPLVKIICTFIFILFAIIVHNPVGIFVLMCITLFMLLSTRISIKVYYNIFENLKHFFIFVFVIFTLCSLSFSFGLIVLIKFMLIVIYITILTLTTPTLKIIYGLEQFLFPMKKIKINNKVLAFNIGLFLTYTGIFIDTRNNILKSLAIRGLDYRSGFVNYCKAYIKAAKPSVILSLEKFKKFKRIMKKRFLSKDCQNFGFDKFGLFDFLIISIHIILIIFLIMKGVVL